MSLVVANVEEASSPYVDVDSFFVWHHDGDDDGLVRQRDDFSTFFWLQGIDASDLMTRDGR